MRSKLYRWSWAALDLLFPPNCASCGNPGQRWCQVCRAQVIRIESPFCNLCGQPTNNAELCCRCKDKPTKLTAIRSWAVFDGPVRNALHRVKYFRDVALAEVLSHELHIFVKELNWPLNLILPVPLSKQRLKERGYNQAAILARPLAWDMGLPIQEKALRRIKDTASQVGLDYDQRKKNVSDAFVAVEKLVARKNVLVVDDVATSGSTLDACADALWAAGVSKVYGLTLTRAVQSE